MRLHDESKHGFPVVTFCLVAANVLAFAVFMHLDRVSAVRSMGFVPSDPKIGSLITSLFYHGSAYHLSWNMLFLWLFAPKVEEALGKLQFLLLYFGSGAAALLVNMLIVRSFAPASMGVPVIGASGAIAGILGLFAVRFYRTRLSLLTVEVPAVLILGAVFLQQVIAGVWSIGQAVASGISYWSHVGGAAFGIVMGQALSLGTVASKEHIMRAVRHSLDQGDNAEAVRCLEHLLTHDPDDAEALSQLAKIHAIREEDEQSVACFRRGIAAHLKRQSFDKAVECFGEFKHYHKGVLLDAALEYQIARHLADSASFRIAVGMLKSIAAAYPEAPEAELALMKAGDTYLNCLNDPKSAVVCFDRCLERFPHSPLRARVEKSAAECRSRK